MQADQTPACGLVPFLKLELESLKHFILLNIITPNYSHIGILTLKTDSVVVMTFKSCVHLESLSDSLAICSDDGQTV